ncbi:MAG TPA: SDR family NAD(P)-dependent oxidoreductase [Gemmatimonadaceae bacterium]|jgi:3-oxoacyl-[acyl-carrier protein] reductase
MADRPVLMVTGSTRGIGRGIASYFLEKGYYVAGCSRGASELESDAYTHATLDIADEDEVRVWVRGVRKKYGGIDLLVCNAGLAPAAVLMTMTPGDLLESIFRTNVNGTFFVCREVAKAMVAQRSGRIVTMSSMAAAIHEEGTAAYAASKAAIVELTKVLAKEVAPAGVTCNVIAPSMFPSEQFSALGEEVTKRALERLVVKRVLTIGEICNVIEFLAAPESRVITGQVIHMGLVS